MVDIGIPELRSQFEEQRQQVQQVQEQVRPTAAQLFRASASPLQAQLQRQATQAQIKTAQRQVSEQQTSFEREVAAKAPEQALPEYLEAEYQNVLPQVQSRVSQAEAKVANIKADIKRYEEQADRAKTKEQRQSLNKEIFELHHRRDEAEAELQGYKEGLQGSKAEVISKWNTGYTHQLADYYRAKEEASTARAIARREAKLQPIVAPTTPSPTERVGAITIGGVHYVGGAYVPQLGKTAGQATYGDIQKYLETAPAPTKTEAIVTDKLRWTLRPQAAQALPSAPSVIPSTTTISPLFPTPTMSKLPTTKDVAIGTTTLGGITYRTYLDQAGKTFLGEEVGKGAEWAARPAIPTPTKPTAPALAALQKYVVEPWVGQQGLLTLAAKGWFGPGGIVPTWGEIGAFTAKQYIGERGIGPTIATAVLDVTKYPYGKKVTIPETTVSMPYGYTPRGTAAFDVSTKEFKIPGMIKIPTMKEVTLPTRAEVLAGTKYAEPIGRFVGEAVPMTALAFAGTPALATYAGLSAVNNAQNFVSLYNQKVPTVSELKVDLPERILTNPGISTQEWEKYNQDYEAALKYNKELPNLIKEMNDARTRGLVFSAAGGLLDVGIAASPLYEKPLINFLKKFGKTEYTTAEINAIINREKRLELIKRMDIAQQHTKTLQALEEFDIKLAGGKPVKLSKIPDEIKLSQQRDLENYLKTLSKDEIKLLGLKGDITQIAKQVVETFSKPIYVSGPEGLVKQIRPIELKGMGVEVSKIKLSIAKQLAERGIVLEKDIPKIAEQLAGFKWAEQYQRPSPFPTAPYPIYERVMAEMAVQQKGLGIGRLIYQQDKSIWTGKLLEPTMAVKFPKQPAYLIFRGEREFPLPSIEMPPIKSPLGDIYMPEIKIAEKRRLLIGAQKIISKGAKIIPIEIGPIKIKPTKRLFGLETKFTPELLAVRRRYLRPGEELPFAISLRKTRGLKYPEQLAKEIVKKAKAFPEEQFFMGKDVLLMGKAKARLYVRAGKIVPVPKEPFALPKEIPTPGPALPPAEAESLAQRIEQVLKPKIKAPKQIVMPVISAKITKPRIKEAAKLIGRGLSEQTQVKAAGVGAVLINKQIDMFKTKQVQISQQLPKLEEIQRPIEIEKTITDVIPVEIPALAPAQIQAPALVPAQVQVPSLVPIQIQIPRLRAPTITPPVPRAPTIPEIKPPRIPRIIKPKEEKKPKYISKKKRKLAPLYVPEVKMRGVFVAAGKPLIKPEAVKRGEFIAKTTAAATFRVRPTKLMGPVPTKEYKPSPALFRPYAIRKGKPVALKDTFIQKTKKRIISPGEKAEISFKGVAARQARRVKWL